MTLRQYLGESEHALKANRTCVWLDASMVTVHRSGKGEFLEGLDVTDPEWKEWLSEERASQKTITRQIRRPSSPTLAPPAPSSTMREVNIVLSGSSSGKGDEVFIDGSLLEILSRNLSETSGINPSLGHVADNALRLKLTSKTFDNGTAISALLSEQPAHRFLWSSQTETTSGLPGVMVDKKVYGLLFQAMDAIGVAYLDRISAENADGSTVGETLASAHQVMSFDVERIGNACEVLSNICSSETFAPAYGWLLFAIRASHYENSSANRFTRDEIEEVCERALECGRSNAFVVSAVSATYLRLLDRFDDGVALAHRAFSLAPSNPFAIDALASAFYMGDMIEKGYLLSRAAAMLSRNTSFSSFFAMSQCVGATLYGRLDEARQLAISASAVSPKLRSAWRFRLALAANSGDFNEAGLCKRMLERHERNFDVDRMLHDPAYPVHSIRASSIEMQRIREF
ncbi:MAG: tetratricopeptide repeat protein [Pseudomonadota bacterium]